MSIEVAIVPVTPFQQNCSVVKCEATGRAAIVDPGGDIESILGAVERLDCAVEKILLTHGHMDHCAASDILRRQLAVPIEGPHVEDAFWIEQLPASCRIMGVPEQPPFTPDRWLEEGDTVTVGEQRLRVLHCPGHTPGHVVFVYDEQRVAWVGDVLFQGSIGRTDFPRGDHRQLLGSIRGKLFPLGDDITFIPGHGPTSTFGRERRSNPFVADSRHG